MKRKLFGYLLVCGLVVCFGFVGAANPSNGGPVQTQELPTIY